MVIAGQQQRHVKPSGAACFITISRGEMSPHCFSTAQWPARE